MAEWLRRWTRNPLGCPRAVSNPTDYDKVIFYFGFAQRMFLLSGKKQVRPHQTFEPPTGVRRPQARQRFSFSKHHLNWLCFIRLETELKMKEHIVSKPYFFLSLKRRSLQDEPRVSLPAIDIFVARVLPRFSPIEWFTINLIGAKQVKLALNYNAFKPCYT